MTRFDVSRLEQLPSMIAINEVSLYLSYILVVLAGIFFLLQIFLIISLYKHSKPESKKKLELAAADPNSTATTFKIANVEIEPNNNDLSTTNKSKVDFPFEVLALGKEEE